MLGEPVNFINQNLLPQGEQTLFSLIKAPGDGKKI